MHATIELCRAECFGVIHRQIARQLPHKLSASILSTFVVVIIHNPSGLKLRYR
jgi:hypothetical protein